MLTNLLCILHHALSCATWEKTLAHLGTALLWAPITVMGAMCSTLLGPQPGVRGEGVVSALLWVSFHCFCLPCPFQHRGDSPNNQSLPGEIGLVDKLRDFCHISFI